METLISLLIAIIGGLGFLFFRKSKENTQLKVDKSLSERKQDSELSESKVESAEKDIEKIDKEMKKPVDDSFWDDYTKGK